MLGASPHRPNHPNTDVPDQFEPAPLPVEPDEGPGPAVPPPANDLALPHERDQSSHTTAPLPDPVIEQAKRDIDAGLVDTDMRATPGLDAHQRAKLVPGPGGKPPVKGR